MGKTFANKSISAIVDEQENIVGQVAWKGKRTQLSVYNGGGVFVETPENVTIVSFGVAKNGDVVLTRDEQIEIAKGVERIMEKKAKAASEPAADAGDDKDKTAVA